MVSVVRNGKLLSMESSPPMSFRGGGDELTGIIDSWSGDEVRRFPQVGLEILGVGNKNTKKY